MFAFKLAIFSIFTVSGKNIVKCFEVFFSEKNSYLCSVKSISLTCENDDQNKVENSSDIFKNLRRSSEIFRNNRELLRSAYFFRPSAQVKFIHCSTKIIPPLKEAYLNPGYTVFFCLFLGHKGIISPANRYNSNISCHP